MRKNLSVSVAMTTCNGEKYVAGQIESILAQLEADDRLVIADDGSTDKTLEIVKGFASIDDRIKLLYGNSLGIVRNFEKAIKECSNELIFLSDQDDVWVSDKVKIIKEYFLDHQDVTLIMSDLIVVNQDLETVNESYMKLRGCSTGIVRNIMKNSYVGCALAFRRELKELFLPFPKGIPMHDSWIGLLAEMFGKVRMIEDKLVLYRRYKGNVTSLTSNSSVFQKMMWRMKLSYYLMMRKFVKRGSNL
jgi:glycosyltransferase involved in cell wall biosynthesis